MKRRRLLDALEGVVAVALLVAIEDALRRDAQRRWHLARAAEIRAIVDQAYIRMNPRAYLDAWPDIDGWRERCQKGEIG